MNITEDFRLLSLENYYDNNSFLEQLTAGGKLTNFSVTKKISYLYKTILNFFTKVFVHKKKMIEKDLLVSSCPFAILFK